MFSPHETQEEMGQQSHADLFGRAVVNWFRQENFSQDIPHYVASAMEWAGPWNSQLSQLQRGTLKARSEFWVSLGLFNQMLASQDFEQILDQKLKDRLRDRKPFMTIEGKPARGHELFGMFCGELEIPEQYTSRQVLTNDEARKVSMKFKQDFEKQMAERMESRKELFESLSAHLETSDFYLKKLRMVLIGENHLTPDDLETLEGPLNTALQKAELAMRIG